MELYRKSYTFYPEDTATDVQFAFDCSEQAEELQIQFSFSPDAEPSEEICRPQIEQAIRDYHADYDPSLQPMDWKRHMPVKNLITLSLDREGVYLGNAHRWNKQQIHRIRTDRAALGFVPPERLAEHWSGMLHLHEVISEKVEAELIVTEV